jgi:hypothetical protein
VKQDKYKLLLQQEEGWKQHLEKKISMGHMWYKESVLTCAKKALAKWERK